VLGGSIAVIAGAWLFQYVGKLQPCELCLLERWPYYITIPLLAVAALTGHRRAMTIPLLMIIALLFLSNAGLSFYHVGVEHHWFAGPTECTGAATEAISVEALQAQLTTQQPVRCDVVQWALFGVSLAGWNLVASAAFAALSFTGLGTAWRAPAPRQV
jgi:disulfide bond formation protein DsbB